MELKNLYEAGKRISRGVILAGVFASPLICEPTCNQKYGSEPDTKAIVLQADYHPDSLDATIE